MQSRKLFTQAIAVLMVVALCSLTALSARSAASELSSASAEQMDDKILPTSERQIDQSPTLTNTLTSTPAHTTTLTGCVPDLVSPAPGAVMDNGRDDLLDGIIWDFDWSDCLEATQYHLYVMGPSATDPVIDNPSISASSYHYSNSGAYIEDRFGWGWRVRAMVDGQWGDWTPWQYFDVEPVNTDPPPEPPPNDLCINATVIPASGPFPYSTSQDTIRATTSADDPNEGCGAGVNSQSVWFKFTPSSDGTLAVDTCGSSYDTVLSIVSGSCGAWSTGACNDDAPCSGSASLQSSQSLVVSARQLYYIEVTQFGSGPVSAAGKSLEEPGQGRGEASALLGGALSLNVDFTPGSQPISNPSFETDGGWYFLDNGEYWTGEYATGWSSHGARSYQIHIPPTTSCDNYPGANTYGQVSEQVDLTGINALRFDLRTYGGWDVPVLGPEYYHSAEVWIDSTRVYYREREEGEFYDEQIDCSGFTGTHQLTFLMQGYANFCSTVDRGMYVDNIREPTGVALGDVNDDGVVSSTDALIVLSADVGMDTSQFCPMNCGDANGDGLVTSTDALIILSYDAGITVPFPVGTGACPSSITQPPGCSP